MQKAKTVLVLDTDYSTTVEVADLFQWMFKDFSVLVANKAEDGIKLAKENPIDLVVMDLFIVDGVRMSEDLGNLNELPITTLFHKDALHGDQIIEEMKKHRPQAKIMICSTESPYDGPFTSTHQHAAAMRVQELGFDGLLPKPIDPNAFIKMVEKLLNIKAKKKLEL